MSDKVELPELNVPGLHKCSEASRLHPTMSVTWSYVSTEGRVPNSLRFLRKPSELRTAVVVYAMPFIFERAGHLIARSTLAQWVGECAAQLQPLVNALADELRRHAVLHADELPVSMLKPKHLSDGKAHKAYIWSYCTTSINATKAVVFQFAEGRSGESVQQFLQLDTSQAWRARWSPMASAATPTRRPRA